jgi:hypothetical protein
VIEHTLVTARVEELTIGPVLVEVDTARLAIAARHHVALIKLRKNIFFIKFFNLI